MRTWRARPPTGSSYRLAVSSIACALRWRAVGRCASQQPAEQKTSFIRPALHAVTEQRKYLAPNAIGLRHMEHTANWSAGIAGRVAPGRARSAPRSRSAGHAR